MRSRSSLTMPELLFFITFFTLAMLAAAQEFSYSLKPPAEIVDSCANPGAALQTGFCLVDGDTVKVLADLGEGEYRWRSLRITGVNTPESRTTNLREKELAGRVKLAVDALLASLEPTDIKIVSLETAKFYGRVIGDLQLWSDPNFSLSFYLTENSLALPYNGEAREGWTEDELDAVERGLERLGF